MCNFHDMVAPGVESYDKSNFVQGRELRLTWRDVEWLRETTDLPIVVKGIQAAEDAALAAQHGAAAVVVSNHGGWALKQARSTIAALPEVVEAAAGQIEVYLDGGIRRGTDVLKALALGARAVLIARPVYWALAVDGEEGVVHMLGLLRAELDEAMVYCGVTDVSHVEASLATLPRTMRELARAQRV
jgi:isopentenyl diphosphate isomerase/L-lactate dehydrogenase-like FMN-dependent dehydrogenase